MSDNENQHIFDNPRPPRHLPMTYSPLEQYVQKLEARVKSLEDRVQALEGKK